MQTRTIIMLLACSVSMASQAKIYQCEENGKTIFSQTPCVGDSIKEVTVTESYHVDNAEQDKGQEKYKEYLQDYEEKKAQEQKERQFKRKINAAIYQKEVMIGMTAQEVKRSWGKPNKINTSSGSFGKHDQYVYYRANNVTQYVYLENGIVTSWSNN